MRTFIFGAGASVHAGYPLTTELWPAMERWASAAPSPDGDYFRDVVDTMNAKFDRSHPFEMRLGQLYERIDALSKASPPTPENREKHLLIQTRFGILKMIPLYFDSRRVQPAEIYGIFAADVLVPGDAVITFNYDLALDRELKRSGKWSIGNGYGFHVFGSDESPCMLFKLHGSTSWRGELFGGLRGGQFAQMSAPPLGERPVIPQEEFAYLGYENASDPQCKNGPAHVETIIPPIVNKKFFKQTSAGREWEEFWNWIWHQAAVALKDSSEVYLIGYSIPEYDTRARELIQKQIHESVPIKVCCRGGTAAVVASLKSLGKDHAQAANQTTFEGWVADMKTKLSSRAVGYSK